MEAGTLFIRTWRILSILGLIFTLFNSYISYPGEVAIRFNEIGQAIQYMSRETVFYVSVAIFLINNTLLNTLAKLFKRVPTAQIPVVNQAVWANHRDQLNQVFTNWFFALMAAINTILALALLVLSLLNRSNVGPEPEYYVWLLPLSTFIIISVLVALPIRLLMKPSRDV